MINPSDITKFDRTNAELEEFWLFCLVVAGKTAVTQTKLLQGFLDSLDDQGQTPFQRLQKAIDQNILRETLITSRLGQYNRLLRAFEESLSLDLRRCEVADLEAIYGVGPKTARLFLLHSRPNQRLAAIDTHILKMLREEGIAAPKTTPTGRLYQRLEAVFLRLADAKGLSAADYDLQVWKRFQRDTKLDLN